MKSTKSTKKKKIVTAQSWEKGIDVCQGGCAFNFCGWSRCSVSLLWWQLDGCIHLRKCIKTIHLNGCISLYIMRSTQLYLSLSHTFGLGPPGSSLHGTFQARTLEWVAASSSRGSSQPRDLTCISCISGKFFTTTSLKKSHCI